jgi:hypothetical protein
MAPVTIRKLHYQVLSAKSKRTAPQIYCSMCDVRICRGLYVCLYHRMDDYMPNMHKNTFTELSFLSTISSNNINHYRNLFTVGIQYLLLCKIIILSVLSISFFSFCVYKPFNRKKFQRYTYFVLLNVKTNLAVAGFKYPIQNKSSQKISFGHLKIPLIKVNSL